VILKALNPETWVWQNHDWKIQIRKTLISKNPTLVKPDSGFTGILGNLALPNCHA
jgi:hypothetical protein